MYVIFILLSSMSLQMLFCQINILFLQVCDLHSTVPADWDSCSTVRPSSVEVATIKGREGKGRIKEELMLKMCNY